MSSIKVRLERAERLINRNRAMVSPCASMVLPEGEKWRLDFNLWDGKPGSGGKRITSYHDSIEDAQARYDELIKPYPGAEGTLIVMDLC